MPRLQTTSWAISPHATRILQQILIFPKSGNFYIGLLWPNFFTDPIFFGLLPTPSMISLVPLKPKLFPCLSMVKKSVTVKPFTAYLFTPETIHCTPQIKQIPCSSLHPLHPQESLTSFIPPLLPTHPPHLHTLLILFLHILFLPLLVFFSVVLLPAAHAGSCFRATPSSPFAQLSVYVVIDFSDISLIHVLFFIFHWCVCNIREREHMPFR